MVYSAIRDAIVDKSLPPGAAVSEVELARQLNVSKTPVREVILRLRELHLIEADANRRLRVVRPSLEAITSAYETRAALESAAAGLAAIRSDATKHAEMKDAAVQSVRFAEAREGLMFRQWDRKFHTAIADAAESRHLTQLIKDFLLLTEVMRTRDAPVTGDSIDCSREHLAIADAIVGGDEELASKIAASHVRHVATNVLAAFSLNAELEARLV